MPETKQQKLRKADIAWRELIAQLKEEKQKEAIQAQNAVCTPKVPWTVSVPAKE